jgi:hypothetical protein
MREVTTPDRQRFTPRQIVLVVLGLSAATGLFAFGLSYPITLRVRGDAATYLRIAAEFEGLPAALSYAGERSAGMPLFDYLAREVLHVLVAEPTWSAWVNTICILLFAIHLATSWSFARWALASNLLDSRYAQVQVFALLASCPALVGHTTTPLTDTLSIDLVLLALVVWTRALGLGRLWQRVFAMATVGLALAFSTLLRPAYLLGSAGFLLVALAAELALRPRHAYLPVVALVACAAALAPFGTQCAQRYGRGLCLQDEATFDSTRHAQVGMRGARVLWYQRTAPGDILPVLPDSFMMSNFYERCRLTSIAGMGESSLSGCLLSRPIAAPIYVVKKWIGMFDHFRFTPYLEANTPAWLRWLSRTYDVLYWLGLVLCPLWLVRLTRGGISAGARDASARRGPVTALLGFSAIMLAEHTALHIEDRFSLPLLPLCALALVGYAGALLGRYHAGGVRAIRAPTIYAGVASLIFIAQIVAWDAQLP